MKAAVSFSGFKRYTILQQNFHVGHRPQQGGPNTPWLRACVLCGGLWLSSKLVAAETVIKAWNGIVQLHGCTENVKRACM